MNRKGLYVHIPFCASKCAYCDFYSLKSTLELMDSYVTALIKESEKYKVFLADTLYLGGGTPSLLGAERLEKLLFSLHKSFDFCGEATLEANPADDLYKTLKAAKLGGINRISLGVQSAMENELRLLSRRHKNSDVERTVNDCVKLGIKNISLDLMLGIPEQTKESLQKSMDFLCSFNPTHISAYILKLEEGTPLYRQKDTLNLPNSDEVASLYLFTVNYLSKKGYIQYEISNFAKKGYQSQHNLKYWHGEEYIGIGPAAHGFLNGKRYYYDSYIEQFITCPKTVFECDGGGAEEYIMLALRLKSGLIFNDYRKKYGELPENLLKKAALYEKHGLCELTENCVSLTPKGFLVSNEIITEFLI